MNEHAGAEARLRCALEEVTEAVDAAIASLSDRSLADTSEVIDLLLDLRLIGSTATRTDTETSAEHPALFDAIEEAGEL